MNFIQHCQKFVRDLGLKNSIATVTGQTGMNQKVVDWVADADELIQSLWFNWRFLLSEHSDTTIVGTLEYAAPTDLGTWDLDSFYINYTSDDYVHLQELKYDEWRRMYRQGTQTNDEPNQFVIAPNNNIYLEPRPDAAYALTADYWKTPTRMTDNTDTTPIPDRFQRIITARAKIFWAEHEENPAVLELASIEYQDILRRLEAAELQDRQDVFMSSADLVMRVE